jgi:hypothetical protein
VGVFDTATKKISDLLGITAKGQATMANSLPVALASNQSSIPAAGDIAHDATDSGNPLKIGGKAATSEPAAVANGDRVNAYFDVNGRQGVFAAGDVAHDTADSGNPIKVGGKAVSSAPTDVTANDRVNAQFDQKGRLAVFAGHGGTMVVAGDVNSVSQGDTPHDAADSGSPVKIGGKASTSLPSAVANGDRVDAYFDDRGRLGIQGSVSVTGSVSSTVGGDTNAGNADGGNPIKIGGRGVSTAPTPEADNDRVNAQFDLQGRLAVFAGHGEVILTNDADTQSAIESVQAVLENAQGRQISADSLSVIRAKSAETAVYGTVSVTGHSVEPVLYRKNNDGIDGAATAVVGDFGFARFASNTDDIYYFLPVQQYRHLGIAVRNSMDVSLNVSLLGYLRNGTTQEGLLLATAVTIATNNVAMFSANAKATGASADLYAIPNLGDWDYIGIKCEAVATAGSGGVTLLVKRDE